MPPPRSLELHVTVHVFNSELAVASVGGLSITVERLDCSEDGMLHVPLD
jgi:hypothetical protein